MAYFVVDNFGAGMDVRRSPVGAPAGTLRDLLNGHVTPGGEIEKRAAFVEAFDVAGSFGIVPKYNASGNPQMFVYGISGTPWSPQTYAPPFGNSCGLQYNALTGYTNANLNRISSYDSFQGGIIISCRQDQTGSFEVFYNAARVTLSSPIPAFLKTFGAKVYGAHDTNLRFTAVLAPTDWTTSAAGAGTIDTSASDSMTRDIGSMARYFGRLALFGNGGVQIWDMDADPAANEMVQAIAPVSSGAIYATTEFGNGDVIYMSLDGIRSLRARDSSNVAAVSDIGSPVDPLIRARIEADSGYRYGAGHVDETSGRYMLAFDDGETFVLSAYPGPGVTAWSRYLPTTPAGALITGPNRTKHLCGVGGITYIRNGTDNKIYALEPGTYDDCECVVVTPYHDMQNPAAFKTFHGLDLVCEGTWTVEASFDPDNVTWEAIGTITRTTLGKGTIGLGGHAPLIALRFRTTSATRARIASYAINFSLSEDG